MNQMEEELDGSRDMKMDLLKYRMDKTLIIQNKNKVLF